MSLGALGLVVRVGVNLIADLNSETDVAVGMVEGVLVRSSDDFSAESRKYISLFLGHFLGHGNNHSVASGSGGH